MYWLTGWGYRKSHKVNGTVAGAQTDYQVRVKVHRATDGDSGEDVYVGTKCRADFGDIRFTKSDGTTELDYWFEEIDGIVATFWVKVDSISESPDDVTIYIYYGKADATTTSNIKDASWNNIGDDFQDNSRDTDIWDVVSDGTGNPNEVNQRLELACPIGADVAGYITKISHSIHNVEMRILGHNTVIQSAILGLHSTKVTDFTPFSFPQSYRAMLYNEADMFYVQKRMNGGVVVLYGAGWISSENIIKIRIEDDTIRFYEGVTERASEGWSPATRDMFISLYGRGWGVNVGTDWVDTFWIRKFVSPEPTHGDWGSEESPEFFIIGVTRDANGNPLGSCIVWLFRTSDKGFVEEKTSGVDGSYSFTVGDDTMEHFVRSHKDGVPNVFGTTDRDLKGVE